MIFWIVLFAGLMVLGGLKAHKHGKRFDAAGGDAHVWNVPEALVVLVFGPIVLLVTLLWIAMKYTVLYPFVLLAKRICR